MFVVEPMKKQILLFESDSVNANMITMRLPANLECIEIAEVREEGEDLIYFGRSRVRQKISFGNVESIIMNLDLVCESLVSQLTSLELVTNWQSEGYKNPIYLLHRLNDGVDKVLDQINLLGISSNVFLIHMDKDFELLVRNMKLLATRIDGPFFRDQVFLFKPYVR